ncbi:hypothetical protein [Flavobacterium xanthum]|uniref:Uncharacterized protein n=1 Tax=Flavobacterium xanthum TaxID=69322 RepID=A0A1M7LFV4_9FLAO|nr:hypothetical protein [Flavobacterium xanthum]SHM77017.1 hypothetical protein SAMN05443669_10713 [Flavobacterium xanthum]
MCNDKKAIFKNDENQNIGEILEQKDPRSIYVLLHAFYTYYTTLMCLDNCLNNKLFNEKQQMEATGRIGFYLGKCSRDIEILEELIIHFSGIENILTGAGINLYTLIKSKFIEVFEKWNPLIKHFDYSNQPYNFTFKSFAEINTK